MEVKASSKSLKKKGTVKEVNAISRAIYNKVLAVQPDAKWTIWSQHLEDKRKTYYDLNFTAAHVYEEMENLLALEGEQIIQEFSTDSGDEASHQKKRRCRRSAAAEHENDDIPSEAEATEVDDSRHETEDTEMVDTPVKQLGQLSLQQSFLNSTMTSQNNNKNKQNGAEQ